jgi:hypothetical protein
MLVADRKASRRERERATRSMCLVSRVPDPDPDSTRLTGPGGENGKKELYVEWRGRRG